ASIWVAQSKGYYQEEGIDAEITIAPGQQGTQGLLAGNLDFMSGGATDIMLIAEKDEVMTAIATTQPVMQFHLIVRPDVLERIGVKPSDSLEKRLAGLKGLRLAVVSEGGAG